MATKKDGVSCYDKAGEEEPIFVLRAQDWLGPELVREWAYRALVLGVPQEKVDEARRCADQMEDWQVSEMGKRMANESSCSNCGAVNEACDCPDSLRNPPKDVTCAVCHHKYHSPSECKCGCAGLVNKRCRAKFFDRDCILVKGHTGYHKNDKGNRWGDTEVILGGDCGKVYKANGCTCLQLKGHSGYHQNGIITWSDSDCEGTVHYERCDKKCTFAGIPCELPKDHSGNHRSDRMSWNDDNCEVEECGFKTQFLKPCSLPKGHEGFHGSVAVIVEWMVYWIVGAFIMNARWRNFYNNHPSGIECVTIVEHMPFNIGNAIKYLWRAGLKDDAPTEQDYDKAIWYIQREKERLKK